jgi:hypothetical protein
LREGGFLSGAAVGGVGKTQVRSAIEQFAQAGRRSSHRMCRRLHSAQPLRDFLCDLRWDFGVCSCMPDSDIVFFENKRLVSELSLRGGRGGGACNCVRKDLGKPSCTREDAAVFVLVKEAILSDDADSIGRSDSCAAAGVALSRRRFGPCCLLKLGDGGGEAAASTWNEGIYYLGQRFATQELELSRQNKNHLGFAIYISPVCMHAMYLSILYKPKISHQPCLVHQLAASGRPSITDS